MTHGEMLVAKGWRRDQGTAILEVFWRTADGLDLILIGSGPNRVFGLAQWRIYRDGVVVRNGTAKTLLGAARESILVATGLIAVSP